MKEIEINNIKETIIERTDYPIERCKEILKDETTAILVRKSKARVLGKNAVFFLNPASNSESRLVEGQIYDLEKREVIETAEDDDSP